MNHPTTTAGLQGRLWEAVAEGDEYAAVGVVQQALDAGVDDEALLLDVIAPVQERVGTEWAANRITVAQEHAATAINERVVASLAHRRPAPGRRTPDKGRVTVGCIDGEWHAFPARLVAEVLSLRGWRVDYLGAQTPTPHLVAHLHHTSTDAVLLSGSLPTHLPTAHGAITACQAIGVPVLTGGRAFGPDGRHARALGADRWAADARGAAAVLEAGIPRPRLAGIRQAAEDLPHLADQEYTMVVRSRGQLVKQTLVDLENRYPAMRGYDDSQRERTAEDLAHIVDFLATALYLDDAELFTTFLTWTADILQARNVPAHSMVTGLDILAGQLRDFPRTVGLLHAGVDALRAQPNRPVPGPETRA
ncbi:cobalamin B12-binding domain-containing protein [Streptomyces mangrovisoli]|uniref:Cobalamin-binding protein n=1 Tax=Streptomyces mangrovisoli TaxID=1428628 RepID=A0A1J4P0F8_9ACTN|nr:B12-binding domain-containing protein [Streptomyces mangrovisoli]OIJ68099.1 cobalamin-binding protein [Streptomyces mangrovisoli]